MSSSDASSERFNISKVEGFWISGMCVSNPSTTSKVVESAVKSCDLLPTSSCEGWLSLPFSESVDHEIAHCLDGQISPKSPTSQVPNSHSSSNAFAIPSTDASADHSTDTFAGTSATTLRPKNMASPDSLGCKIGKEVTANALITSANAHLEKEVIIAREEAAAAKEALEIARVEAQEWKTQYEEALRSIDTYKAKIRRLKAIANRQLSVETYDNESCVRFQGQGVETDKSTEYYAIKSNVTPYASAAMIIRGDPQTPLRFFRPRKRDPAEADIVKIDSSNIASDNLIPPESPDSPDSIGRQEQKDFWDTPTSSIDAITPLTPPTFLSARRSKLHTISAISPLIRKGGRPLLRSSNELGPISDLDIDIHSPKVPTTYHPKTIGDRQAKSLLDIKEKGGIQHAEIGSVIEDEPEIKDMLENICGPRIIIQDETERILQGPPGPQIGCKSDAKTARLTKSKSSEDLVNPRASKHRRLEEIIKIYHVIKRSNKSRQHTRGEGNAMNDQSAIVQLKDNDRGSPKAPIQPGEPIDLGVFWSRNAESQRLVYASYSEPPDFPVEFMFSRASTFERQEKARLKQSDRLEANSQESTERLAKAAEHKHPNEGVGAITSVNSPSKECNKSYTTADVLETFFSRSVMERFAEYPGLCVGITKKSAPCTNRIAKAKRTIAEASIQRLSELRIHSQVEAYTTELKSIADLIFCHFHKGPARAQIDPKSGRLLDSPTYSSKLDALIPDLPDQGKGDENCIPTIVPSPQYTQTFYRYIQVLSPYRTKIAAKYSIQENLMRVISNPLTPTELKTGSIYAYWFQPNFGNRKIGWTRGAVQTRMRGWERDCKHHVELVYPSPGSKQVYVPHASRLEKLIHAELHAYRRIEECCKGCGRKHIEWSTATDEHITRVIEKWTLWMEKKPYEKTVLIDASDSSWSDSGIGKNQVSEWKLKRKFVSTLADLCKPLPLIDPLSKPLIGSAGSKVVRQAPRRSSRVAAKRAATPKDRDL